MENFPMVKMAMDANVTFFTVLLGVIELIRFAAERRAHRKVMEAHQLKRARRTTRRSRKASVPRTGSKELRS